MSDEIPYQVAPQVEALRQERANCVAYGNDKRVASIDRQLAEYGVTDAPRDRRSKEAGQTQASGPVVEDVPKGNASRDDWAVYAAIKGAPNEETQSVEDGGLGRDELRAKYGATEGD